MPGLTVELGGDIFSETAAARHRGVRSAARRLHPPRGVRLGALAWACHRHPLFGIAIGIAVVELLANVMPVPDFTTQVAAMIAIGVGIDYAPSSSCATAKFEGRRAPDVAVLGRSTRRGAVVFAASRSSSPSRDVPHGRAFRRPAVDAAIAVLLVMLGSITLLPALLGFVGLNIDRFAPPSQKHEAAAAQKESLWHRWARTAASPVAPMRAACYPGSACRAVLLVAPRHGRRGQPAHH